MSIVDALSARNEPLLVTPLSVRSSSYRHRSRLRRHRNSSSNNDNEMDEDGIYGGRIGRISGGTGPTSAAANATNTTATIVTKSLNLHQCRSYTSLLLVLSFVQNLLKSGRTTTTREVYYYYVTHFRSQRECDAAILDCAALLQVPRVALGLAASPKGWFCGCVEIVRCGDTGDGVGVGATGTASRVDGTALSSSQGLPITREWIDRSTPTSYGNNVGSGSTRTGTCAGSPAFQISTRDAKCILVIEKEGVYNRLSEDRFYDRYPSILVTGKGFPDLATRALVHALHTELQLPVYGLCDCNPGGIGVLQTYRKGSARMGLDGTDRYGVPIQWIGLRPSQVHAMRSDLPSNVFQSLTEWDRKKIGRLGEEGSSFLSGDGITTKSRLHRRRELALMDETGVKVELESLHWLGMDYMCKWLEKIVVGHEKGTMHSGSDIEDYDEEDDASSSSSSSSSSVDRDEEMRSLTACII